MSTAIQEFRRLNPRYRYRDTDEVIDAMYKHTSDTERKRFPSRREYASAIGADFDRLNEATPASAMSYTEEFKRGLTSGVQSLTKGTFWEIAHFVARNTGLDGLEKLSDSALDDLDRLLKDPAHRASYEAQTGDYSNLNLLGQCCWWCSP